jgi:exportin-1
MRILEITPENRAALLLGLEYLIGISYVDDTEVFKVGMLKNVCHTNTVLARPPRHWKLYRSAFSYETLQVCLDYWNVFVLELFEAHNQMEPAAAVSMMGLQVLIFLGYLLEHYLNI